MFYQFRLIYHTMKKVFLIFFLVPFVHSIHAQIITFTDPVFKAKLLESSPGSFVARDLSGEYFSIDANSNAEIEISEAMQVGYLEIENSSITSIAEIFQFTNLTFLNCENNLLTALDVSGLSNINSLNCSTNQLINLNVSGLTELQNLNCQYNQLTTLNVGGISNLLNLNCSYNQLGIVNLNNLLNLEILNCNDNLISTFDLSDLTSLKSLDCSNNQLLALNIDNLVSLEMLNCSSNVLESLTIQNLVYFYDLNCGNNQLNTLSLINLPSLNNLNCNFNQLSSLNLNNLTNLVNLSCTNNQLSSLNLFGLTQLKDLNCSNNIISTIVFFGLDQLISFNCSLNQLVNLDVSSLTNLKYLFCDYNAIVALDLNDMNDLLALSCTNNQIANLNLTSLTNLQSVYCNNNQITTLNLSNASNLQSLFCYSNQLTSIFIKNGSFEGNLSFANNPSLNYICADEYQIEFIQDEINNNNYTNCHVNSYCSFVPGGISYTIQGSTKFDSNTNGCDALDGMFPNLQMSFSDGSITESLISNTSGSYSKSVKEGSYTITPILENPNYFSISPSIVSVEFPFQTSPIVQNFCITPNGSYNDVEIAIIPLNNAIPDLESRYKIVYKNKGTTLQSGSVNLNFNDSYLNLVSSNPVISSQSTNNLNWTFSNLNPFETRSILVTLKVNSSTDTPATSIGQLLPFNATITTIFSDETPNDNTITFIQEVSESATTNDKVCIEGNIVSLSQVGEYVHYCIRFTNSGNAVAQNVVIKDLIDVNKYNIFSLIPLEGSHVFETRVTNLNTVEFTFENINLAFDTNNNNGYVMFKIKTLPSLSVGDIFSNSASIYFDYKAPAYTAIESTIIQILGNNTFETSTNFTIYPNPVKETLHIFSFNLRSVDSISIFNSVGQIVKNILNPTNLSINVSDLSQGIYYLNITSENIKTSHKFIKE